LSQAFIDFELLIVNDDSSDGIDELFHGFMTEWRITIRDAEQSNGGKNVTFNREVQESGRVFDLDSSCEFLMPAKFNLNCFSISELHRGGSLKITCLSMSGHGFLVGNK
jgi:glycosyltransferase involved in cell wall biosynthesis